MCLVDQLILLVFYLVFLENMLIRLSSSAFRGISVAVFDSKSCTSEVVTQRPRGISAAVFDTKPCSSEVVKIWDLGFGVRGSEFLKF